MNISVIGGDLRQLTLAKLLEKAGENNERKREKPERPAGKIRTG